MKPFGHFEDSKFNEKQQEIPDISADIQLSMDKMFLNGFHEDDDVSVKIQNVVVLPLNPHISNAITLHKHCSDIMELIKLKESSKNEGVELKPPIYKNLDDLLAEKHLNFTKQDFRNYEKGYDVDVLELSKNVIQKILIKSVASLFAQLGYETCEKSALDVLIDVLDTFLRRISHNLAVAIEDEENNRAGFPNVIERVLTEMGLGGVRSLNDYYQNRVLKYISVLENRYKSLTEEYYSILEPKSPLENKFNKVVTVKVEKEDISEMENREVHFSTIDSDVNLSIFETGYQLLNSLEAENLHSMTDGVEDIPGNENSSIAGIPSEDLSPFSKKKRLK